jgi:hypothetical protein
MSKLSTCALCCSLLLAAASCRARAITVTQDGQPTATIVTAPEPDDKTKAAVAELRHYVQRISGAELPVATDADKVQGALVLVGRSRLTDAMGVKVPSGLTNERRGEGFVVACRGDRLVLAGNNDGPYHGTEYAVYEFLDRLGVRWYMPGEFGEVVPQQKTITFAEVDVREQPDFVMRNWWLHTTPEMAALERQWKLRNKMNPEQNGMFATPGDSSARNIVDGKLFAEHPEYFAMNADGSRNQHLPSLSHPMAVEIAANVIKEHFRRNPNANSYGFAPDDGLPRDYNPETLKRHQGFVDLLGRPGVPAEASTSEEWFTFVNSVAAAVRKEFPDRYIATNGYANRNLPPQGMKLDDHLVVMFAAIWSDTLHAYDDPKSWQMVRQGQLLKRWCELCPNVWIYGYNYVNLVSGLTPVPRVRKLARDFPLMKRWNVMGFLDETRNVWAECGIMTRYVRARLEWDADADVRAILDEFYPAWYGAAAKPARDFWDALDEAIEQTPMLGHEDRIMPYVYTPALLERLGTLLAEAERLADTPRSKLHVRADRLIYDHLAAYVDMHAAEFRGDFAEAARQAQHMLDLRPQLHEINSFFIMPDEEGYKSGVWYWKVGQRRDFHQSLADRTSGKTGDLVAVLPERVRFRTDPHDEGRFAGWFAPDWVDESWDTVLTTKPFYCQGYLDTKGHPYVGDLWYRAKVAVPQHFTGRRVALYIPALETEAWCWVNGEYVGHRPYREAYIRPAEMELDVTGAIQPGKTNVIAIRINTSLCESQAAAGLASRAFLYAPR